MTWHWRLPQPLKKELGITEAELAARASIRRPTVSALRDERDTYTSVLVALYIAARHIRPDVTLHHFIAVEGAPVEVMVRPFQLLPDMAPLPNLPGVYLGTPLLRERFVEVADAPTTLRSLARAAELDETALSRMEHGHLQPKVSTIVRLYQAFLPFDPALTLHDVLLLPPENQGEALLTTGSTEDDGSNYLLQLWEQLPPQARRAALAYIEELLTTEVGPARDQ